MTRNKKARQKTGGVRESIEGMIFTVRDQRVILDVDPGVLYGVETRSLRRRKS